ncbi:myosin-1-like isoform X1 [Chlorella sorokiniana]|uniref:Myosin-1-like isoform X1 n=1 Tax=Chlorella sorokiniana TaxID=3076 RepID=A0A2P6U4H5_CHLSO|nr:myosin-1-like isoform X1 [Chlorella sorokiniana]|eukprot:PRW61206.1 myosin-1-like isoform X1 [Chlorella sorokiniana]
MPTKGSRVWVLRPSEGWRRGTVAGAEGGGGLRVLLDCDQLGEAAGPEITVSAAAVEPANPVLLDGVRDLTHLSYLNEPGILHVLRQRYSGDAVYTMAGPVLVAVNPFKPLPLYGAAAARLYSQRSLGSQAAAAVGEEGWEPHVFLTADRAFKQMVAFQQSQSVLITGESGAGKTETTKIVMRYLAQLAGGTGMEDRVLETNPILEAFGNAKTIHNNNSSRFGKLIEIYFNRSHSICGALIHTYLLEKSRVVHQQPDERSYHIFYQLCRGATEEERRRYLLPASLEEFAYLSGSGCTHIPGVDDAAEFQRVKAAMAAVGISPEQQGELFAVLAAVLWLGNVQFVPLHDDAVTVDGASMPAVAAAAALLQCEQGALLAALTTRQMVAGGEQITRELGMEAALDNRDALSKAIYAAAFRWLVDRINAALTVGARRGETTTLSILDIYGFECFKENSFEQLCINFANERLQQQARHSSGFSKHMFRLEQEVYESESIDWAHVEFVDNQECVDLIEARPPAGVGILSLLDEECMMPKGSDSTFAAKLQQQQAAHPRFSYNTRAPGDDFTIQHYAGPVVYSCTKFLDKNRDTLSKDLVALLQASSAPLVQLLAAEMERGQERRGSQTVGARFRDQLRDLIQRLDATALHFVRCIKPNSQQVAGSFDAPLILHQLRCCGVLEVARIARAGYPTRYLHAEFAARYKHLLPELGPGPLPVGVSVLDVCRQVLAHFGVDESQYQIGRTRLFFRAGVLGHLEDVAARMQHAALLIQSTWRMARCRRAFLAARAAAVTVQAHWRGRRGRQEFAELLRRHRAAVRIQAAARGCAQRKRYRRALAGVMAIQMAWRRHVLQERAAGRLQERRKREDSLRAVAEAKRQEQETFEAVQRDFGVDAGEIRRVLGLWQEHSEAFMQWRQQPPAAQLPARSASSQPPAADDSGLLLEIAAASADAQQQQQRMEGLQIYAHKLERTVDDLREENQLLRRALHTLQAKAEAVGDPAAAAAAAAVLATSAGTQKRRPSHAADAAAHVSLSTGSPAGSSGLPPRPPAFAIAADGTSRPGSGSTGRPGSARPSPLAVPGSGDCSDDGSDSISLMSLNDGDDDSVATGTATPTAASLAAQRNDAAMVVRSLERDLNKKQSLFDDDADFIREVRTGQAEAPGMHPDVEFKRLLMRYKDWKKQFRDRLGSTQKVLKQLAKDEKRAAGLGISVGGSLRRSPTPSMRPLSPSLGGVPALARTGSQEGAGGALGGTGSSSGKHSIFARFGTRRG